MLKNHTSMVNPGVLGWVIRKRRFIQVRTFRETLIASLCAVCIWVSDKNARCFIIDFM